MPWVPLILIVLVLLGAPLFAVIATSALVGFHREGVDLWVVAMRFLPALRDAGARRDPAVHLCGLLLSAGQAPRRLVRLSQALLGWFPGGLAIISLVSCALFTAFTGASGVTIIALGALLHPALMQAGYEERFSVGLLTASGSLGLLFAPSLPLILYGVVAMAPIDDLFVAGVLPGVLILAAAFTAYSYWRNRGRALRADGALRPRGLGRDQRRALGFAAARRRARRHLQRLLRGVRSRGGHRVIRHDHRARRAARGEVARVARIMRESMVLVGAIFIILGVSLASTSYMIDAGVPQALFESVSSFITGPRSFLLVLLVFLLILGAILDIFSATVLVVPLILPLATQYGVNPIHLGIVFIATMELGYLMPPVGLNLFIASHRFDKHITSIYWATQPFSDRRNHRGCDHRVLARTLIDAATIERGGAGRT